MICTTNDTLLLIGDSITDTGRERPLGKRAGLGRGYAKLVWSLLSASYPERHIQVLNTGSSGNRVTDLAERWQDDVCDHSPDWVSVMIGINDVWRQFDGGGDDDVVDVTRYESILDALVAQTMPRVKGMIIMSPFYLETNTADPMRAMMDTYGAAAQRVAHKRGTRFVDVQAAFDHYLTYNPTQSLCGDRVHPNAAGHGVIARALLQSLEYEFNPAEG